jgi:hypothetical protein
MLQFMVDYWWVWLLIFAITIPSLYMTWRDRYVVKAQFVVPAALGCIVLVFNSIGIISAVLSIISGVIHIFLWKVGG